jgi:hypothetical protein
MLKDKLLKQGKRLNLDLTGKVVLTEAATGAYAVTPVLAALSGARVYAFAKANRYGSVYEVIQQTRKISDLFNEITLDIQIITELTPEIIHEADIITNSGHLRPLDKEKLQHAKEGVVIPLMYESWEFRHDDVDIDYAKTRGIKIGATNERHPDIDVFNYLGDMALKMIFDAGLCPYKNNFILMCNNDFGPFIANTLSKVCGSLAVCDMTENREKYSSLQIDWIGNFPEFTVPEKYKRCDAVIFTAYPFNKTWIGHENVPILTGKLKAEIDNPFILRYAGDIDEECRHEIKFYPERVPSGHMGILPSAIGFDPIIRLQSGGLKVGEVMLKNEIFCHGFPLVEEII